jgi:hypothetical protein
MGGVDLLDKMTKNYAISAQVCKWYWCLYAWYLNVSMVQAWQIFRAHNKQRHELIREKEAEEDKKWEEEVRSSNYMKSTIEYLKKTRAMERKWLRAEEKKVEDMGLLEFTREVVQTTFCKYTSGEVATHSRNARHSSGGLSEIRYEPNAHLIRLYTRRGVCKVCKLRTRFRCARCDVALHAEGCFYNCHVPAHQRVDAE